MNNSHTELCFFTLITVKLISKDIILPIDKTGSFVFGKVKGCKSVTGSGKTCINSGHLDPW